MITRTATRARKRLGSFGFLSHQGLRGPAFAGFGHQGSAGRAFAGLGQTGASAPLGIGTGQTWSGYSYSPELSPIGVTGASEVTGGLNTSLALAPVSAGGTPIDAGGTLNPVTVSASGMSSTAWLLLAAAGVLTLFMFLPKKVTSPSSP